MLTKSEQEYILGPFNDDRTAYDLAVNDVEALIDEGKNCFQVVNGIDIAGEAEESFDKIIGIIERLMAIQDVPKDQEEGEE